LRSEAIDLETEAIGAQTQAMSSKIKQRRHEHGEKSQNLKQ
jgi:hypothetical protein